MINVYIDELTPCLKDSKTGDIILTEVVRIKRKSFLQKFNKRNGWYVNWSELLNENEIYALVLAGTVDIQGLIALQPINNYGAVYISWLCTAPHNNKLICNPKYIGVGGHLFAIAIDKSVQYGFNGAITGFASNKKLLEHYTNIFNADVIGLLHPFQFYIDEINSKHIMEVYSYEWTDDEF